MNLSDLIFRSCRHDPERVAVVEGKTETTYRHLDQLIRRCAGRLIEKGGHGRETVALLVPNGLDFAVSYFGALAAGKSVLPLNPALSHEELSFIVGDAGVETLVASPALHDRGAALRSLCPRLRFVLSSEEDSNPGPEGAGFTNQEDLATLLYTSGTTGHPKGVMLTHGNLMANVEGCLEVLDVQPRHRFLAVLPFFHSFGITCSLSLPLVAGATVEIMQGISPARILEALTTRGITHLMAVPTVFGILCRLAAPDVRHQLELVVAGGEPLPGRIARDWEDRFGLPLCEGYGSTETAPVISLTANPHRVRAGRAGQPLPNLEVRVMNGLGPAAPEEVGEIEVRGPSVMKGYLNRPGDTEDVLDPDGWYRTGDLGTVDSDGYLAITGRKKELIISAGENIYPAEIEEALRGIPGVAEAAVIGVPDEVRGEVPKAYICPEPGGKIDLAQIREALKGHLAAFKIPRLLEVRHELPRNATGKVQKQDLR